MVEAVVESRKPDTPEKAKEKTSSTELVLPKPTSHGVPEEIKNESAAFQERLQEFKEKGYAFQVVPGITVQAEGTDSHRYESDVSSYGFKAKYQVSVAGSPYQALCYRYGKLLERPEELSPRPVKSEGFEPEQLVVSPYLVKVSEKEGQPEVRVYDYLTPNRPLVIQERGKDAIEQAMQKLGQYHQSSLPVKEFYLAALQPKKGESAFEVARDISPSEQEKTAIGDMLSRYNFNVEADKHNGEIDRLGRNIEISRREWERAGSCSFQVNGEVSEINLVRELSKEEIKALPQNADEAYKPQKIVDQYGNIIIRGLVGNLKQSENPEERIAHETITILPPAPFAENSPEPNDRKSVDFDASAVGGPKVTGFLVQRPIAPLTTFGSYRIYSNMDEEKTRELGTRSLRAVAKGAERAEEFFGIEPGSQIENIYVVNGLADNAEFRLKDPTTILLYDETLKKNRSSIPSGAFHEGVHLIDQYSQGSLSGGELTNFWQRMKNESPQFLEAINEHNFMPHKPQAGHTQDNAKELLASVVVSLTRPHWQERVRESTPQFQRNYLDCLTALEQNLSGLSQIPESAPIRKGLAEKIELLQSIIDQSK